jgi:hypothetical protein
MSEEYHAWRNLDQAIAEHVSAPEIETMLDDHSVVFINTLMRETDTRSRQIAHTLLYTAINAGSYDVVALLLLRGADPLEPVHVYYEHLTGVNGERRKRTCNAMEACDNTLRVLPKHGIFLLKLLDSRSVATADTEKLLVNILGRDVNAPLTEFPLVASPDTTTINALEFACLHLKVYCARWLLYGRQADPNAVKGGFDTLVRILDEKRNGHMHNGVQQIRALLMEWMAAWRDRRLAVGMADHHRLGSASLLHTLPPDAMSRVAHYLH